MSKHFPWLVILILILAAAARLYHIQTQSIWFDEGWSAFAAVQPTVRAAIEADSTNPPVYYLLLNLLTRGMGDSTLALRWVSTLFGLLVVPLAYQLGKRLFTTRAGLLAAFLTAFCPLLWWASQEARMYTMLAVLVLSAALAWHELLKRSSRWAWLVLWGSELVLLYAHNTGPVVALWLNLVTTLGWVVQWWTRRQLPSDTSLRFKRRSILVWFAGQIAVALVWLPYFVNWFLLLPQANSAVGHISPFNATLLSQLWQAVWTGPWAMVGHEPLIVALSGAIFIVVVISIPWREAAARWLVAHVLILTGGVWVGLVVLGNEIHGRYLVMIAPLLLVLLAAGIINLMNLNQPAVLTRSYRYALVTFMVSLFGFTFLSSVHFATTNPTYQHDDARGMVQYYADHLTANDTVLDWSYADRYELAYYWQRLGVKAHRVTLPEGADLEQILPLLPTSGDVALNVWYTQKADYRGMMTCILGNGTINPPEQFTVYGMSNFLYRAPTLELPQLQPFGISVGGVAKITAVGGTTSGAADRALCLPVKLSLTQKTGADLKAAIIIKNRLGWEVARADALFADAAEQTTSQLTPGRAFTAYPLLRLPYGAPEGEYSIWLRAYDETEQISGYDLVSDGSPGQKDRLIGNWVVSSAAWEQVNYLSELPVVSEVPVNNHLTLIGHNVTGGTFRNGDVLRLAFLWRGSGTLPDLTLADTQGKWSIAIPSTDSLETDSIRLDWREVQIPPDAASGAAEMRLPDGAMLGSYSIESLPASYTIPEFTSLVNVVVPGVGKLVGYSVAGDMTDHRQPFTVTLVWQAQGATEISYTVFAQLVTNEGQVLAQSDALPVQGDRPTTGWRPGEYIMDTHQVVFHADAVSGTARLIVGLYDAATSQRVPVSAGADFIMLQEGIKVR